MEEEVEYSLKAVSNAMFTTAFQLLNSQSNGGPKNCVGHPTHPVPLFARLEKIVGVTWDKFLPSTDPSLAKNSFKLRLTLLSLVIFLRDYQNIQKKYPIAENKIKILRQETFKQKVESTHTLAQVFTWMVPLDVL